MTDRPVPVQDPRAPNGWRPDPSAPDPSAAGAVAPDTFVPAPDALVPAPDALVPDAVAMVQRAFRPAPTAATSGPEPSARPPTNGPPGVRRSRGVGRGPSERPLPPSARIGPVRAALALARIPFELVVALEYLVREFPHLVQDVRSLINSLARLAHDADSGAFAERIAGAASPAEPHGSGNGTVA